MNDRNSQDYYGARAATSRNLACRAANPATAAVHAELAICYAVLATAVKQPDDEMITRI